MKILVSGYYGFGNVGDEAVLQAMIQGFRSRDPKIEISVLSSSPELTKELNRVDSIYRYDWLNILSEMLKADIFVSGGGTLFQNATSHQSFLYYIGLVFLAKLLGKKAAVFAQGFGPLKGQFYRALARFVLNRVDFITLRDKESYREIKELGVNNLEIHVTADPSAILKNPPIAEGKRILGLEGISKTDRPLFGVAIRNVLHTEEKKLFETLAKITDWLSETYNYSPVFFLFQCPQDMQATSMVIGSMKKDSRVIFRVCRPDEMLALISQFGLLIGMRLHSLIFAAMNSVPMLGLSYDPKVEAFMKSIEQPYLKICPDLDFESLKGSIEKILSNEEKIKADLERKTKELRSQAALNFDLFFRTFS